MKVLLQQYASFNAWANDTIAAAILPLDHALIHCEIKSSFNSLYKTLWHVWNAEKIWVRRLEKKPAEPASDPFQGNPEKLAAAMHQMDFWLADSIASIASDDPFLEKFSYTNSQGLPFNEPMWQILVHLFNHNTYHRGQMVTMLRNLGIEKIPATDFIAFCRL